MSRKTGKKKTFVQKKIEESFFDLQEVIKQLPHEYDEHIDDDELENFKTNFVSYDTKHTGNMSRHEVDDLYRDMGIDTDKETMKLILARLDTKKNPIYPDFVSCLEVFLFLKKKKHDETEDAKLAEFINSFVAMGGNTDKTGVVRKRTILDFLVMFELTIDITDLMVKVGLSETLEELSFSEFCTLFQSAEKEGSINRKTLSKIFGTTQQSWAEFKPNYSDFMEWEMKQEGSMFEK